MFQTGLKKTTTILSLFQGQSNVTLESLVKDLFMLSLNSVVQAQTGSHNDNYILRSMSPICSKLIKIHGTLMTIMI